MSVTNHKIYKLYFKQQQFTKYCDSFNKPNTSPQKCSNGKFICITGRAMATQINVCLYFLWLLLVLITSNNLKLTIALEMQTTTTMPIQLPFSLEQPIGEEATTPTTADATDATHPSEIQKAVCTVTAGEVRASAEAVTTKTLQGVCGTAEMNLAFHNLEIKLYKELQDIKFLLQQLSQHSLSNFEGPLTRSEKKMESPKNPTTETLLKLQPVKIIEDKLSKTLQFKPLVVTETNKTPKLKSLDHEDNSRLKIPLRELEVSKFNNTLLTDRDFKVFTYYWKLENFTEFIKSGVSATVESPIFSIKGKTLQIKAFFQHLHRDFLYLQLAYATLKQSNRNNIILDTGGLFKEIGSEKVAFKHKISVLDQNNQRAKDLVSQEFNNLETGFLIPNSVLQNSNYIKYNSLLIQIFLYL